MRKYKPRLERIRVSNKEISDLEKEKLELEIENFDRCMLESCTPKLQYGEANIELIYSTSNPGIINPKIKEGYEKIMNTFKMLLGVQY